MTTAAVSPALLLTGTVRAVERLSPSFVRITLGGDGFEHIGPEGATLDQRIKLIIPNDGMPVPASIARAPSWYAAWLELPEHDRGHLRTYTARFVRGEGDERVLVVDFVLHGTDAQHAGPAGPAAAWAARAAAGDELGVLAPRRGVEDQFGGIEFAPGPARRLLLVADETAVPALASILESLDRDVRGVAVLEVPDAGDFLDLRAPEGIELSWIARRGRPRGGATVEAVRAGCGLDDEVVRAPDAARKAGDGDVWETPVYSSSGERVVPGPTPEVVTPDELYAWVAGDSTTVKAVRRLLVGEFGMPRHRVAFMGYWKDDEVRI